MPPPAAGQWGRGGRLERASDPEGTEADGWQWGRSPSTEDSRLILLDRWLRGLTRSLCLAAELSRQEENSGG